MSIVSHNRTIKGLDGTHQRACEATRAKTLGIRAPRSGCNQASEFPAQGDPFSNQPEAYRHQKEGQGEIVRGGACSCLTHRAVIALDAESSAITLVDLLRHPVVMDNNEDQSFATAFEGLIWDQTGDQSQVYRRAVCEGVIRPLTFYATTQNPSALSFAANRIDNEGGLVNSYQITKDRLGSEGFIQTEHPEGETQVHRSRQQGLEYGQLLFICQHVVDCQGRTHLSPDDKSAVEPKEMGLPLLHFSPGGLLPASQGADHKTVRHGIQSPLQCTSVSSPPECCLPEHH